MTFKQQFNSLCPPAKLYLVMSGVAILLLFVQNLREPKHYQVGSYKIPLHHHNILYFIIKIAIVAGWTWALNKFCSKGYKGVAWFLVIVPYILFFVGIGLVVVSGMKSKPTRPTQPVYAQPAYAHPPVYVQQPVHQLAAPAGPQRALYGREGPIYTAPTPVRMAQQPVYAQQAQHPVYAQSATASMPPAPPPPATQ